MAKKRQYGTWGPCGYGWASMSVKELTDTMKAATIDIRNLQKTHGFDAVAFSGSSGCAIGFVMSVALQIPCIYVRKKNENSHGNAVEHNGKKPIKKYLIVDDFISTGATVEHIINAIAEDAEDCNSIVPECVGIYCYSADDCYKTKISIGGKTYTVFDSTI